MTNCAGCGEALPPNKAPGRKRKWCTERCRKLTLYASRCVDCGTVCNTDGRVARKALRCAKCAKAASKVWTQPAIVAAIVAWADAHGGIPPVASDWNTTLAAERGKPQRGFEFPSTVQVQKEFGSWNAAISAAGFDPFAPGRYGRDGEYPEVIAETVALYRTPMSLEAVAREMGCSAPTVRYRLSVAGEPIRHWSRWDYERERVAA